MKPHDTILDRIARLFTDVAAGLAAFAILVVVLLQVSSRLLGHPVPWTEEATRYLFVWMIFLGLAGGFRNAEAARVTVMISALPEVLRRLALGVYVLSSVLFFALMGWTGLGLVRLQFIMNETAATLIVPMWVIGTIMPLSAALAILCIFLSLRTHRDAISPSYPVAAPHEAPERWSPK
jgi:TRAP-type C4-dicarboxylate transport system permease small subunit